MPDLDEAVRFFVQALGAQELYRSTRGPDVQLMPENFAVSEDARLALAMLRMPQPERGALRVEQLRPPHRTPAAQ